jgi:transcriptional regulator with XRE-family HTH domain
MSLIEAITKEQTERGLSDTKLARLLGIDLSTWSRIKRGQRPPGGKFLKAVMTNLPAVSMAVLDYMRNKKAS